MRASERVAAAIRQKIADGVEGYTPGSTLPPIRQLAIEYGVSKATFDLAVRELKKAGTITGVQGGRLRVPLSEPEPNGEDGPGNAA